MASDIFNSTFLGSKQLNGGFSPSPFIDMASSRTPSNLKNIFPMCEWYAKMDDVVAPIIEKYAVHTVRELDYSNIIDTDQRKVIKNLFGSSLKVRKHSIDLNRDKYAFGNAFYGLNFAFSRRFVCRKCKKAVSSDSVNNYSFKGFQFFFKCQDCGDKKTPKDFFDSSFKNIDSISLTKYSPYDMEIVESFYTGEKEFLFTPPSHMVREVKSGSRFIINRTPKIVLEAMRRGRKIVLDEHQIFHASRGSISSKNDQKGWGSPLPLSIIPAGYLKKVFNKASEVSGVIRSAPLSIIYPESSRAQTPQGNILLAGPVDAFQTHYQEQHAMWKRDPGHVLTMPHPIGQQTLFGDARNFQYYNEVKQQDDKITRGIGYSTDLLNGNAQYNSASVSLRILENQLLNDYCDINDFISWIFKRISPNFNLGEKCPIMKKFKMADDMQAMQIQLRESEGGNMSKSRIYNDVFDLDYDDEQDIIARDNDKRQDVAMARAKKDVAIQVKTMELTEIAKGVLPSKIQREIAKEEALMQQKDPSFAKVKELQDREQQMEQQKQQMALQQQQQSIELSKKEVEIKGVELKKQQQDRLSSEAGLNPSDGNTTDINKNTDEVVSIAEKIMSGKVDPLIPLEKTFKSGEENYMMLIRTLSSMIAKKPNKEVSSIVKAHFEEKRNQQLSQGGQ